MRILYLSIALLVSSPLGIASSFDHSHANWSRFLQANIVTEETASFVNYAEIQKSPQELKKYLKTIEKVTQTEFQGFQEKEQLALLINAYNAYTIKLVLDYYPVSSIRDIKGDFATPWDKKFITLLGTRRSLNELEHEIIRKQYSEPRIHFALVCAARGCPALKDEAYQADKLDEQLDRSTAAFLADKSRNYYDRDKNTIHLSEIFNWYKTDFTKSHKSLPAFVAKYIPELGNRHNEVRVKFTEYDWGLNDTGKRGLASISERTSGSSNAGSREETLATKDLVARKEAGYRSTSRAPSGGPYPPGSVGSGSESGTSYGGGTSSSAPSYGGVTSSSSTGSGTESASPAYSDGVSGGGGSVGSGSETPPLAESGGANTAPSYGPPGSGTESPAVPGSGSETTNDPRASFATGSGSESHSYAKQSRIGSGAETLGSGTESYRSVGSGSESYVSVGSGTESVGSGSESSRTIGSGSENFSSGQSSIFSRSVPSSPDIGLASFRSSSENSARFSLNSEARRETLPVTQDRATQFRPETSGQPPETRTVDLSTPQVVSDRKGSGSSRTPGSTVRPVAGTGQIEKHSLTRESTRRETHLPLDQSKTLENGLLATVEDSEPADPMDRDERKSPAVNIPPALDYEAINPEKKPVVVTPSSRKENKKLIAIKIPSSPSGENKDEDKVVYIEEDASLTREEMKALIQEVVIVLHKLGRLASESPESVEVVPTEKHSGDLTEFRSVTIATSKTRKKIYIPEIHEDESESTNASLKDRKRKHKDETVAPAL